MSFAAKRRLVLCFLVFAVLWPLAHRALVTTFEIDPWRLGGWAMYCTPKLRVEVALVPERAGRPADIELPAALREAAERFTDRRAVLGRFADPSVLARETFDQLDVDSVVVTIQKNRIDPETSRIVGTRDYYRYSRDDAGRIDGERFSTRTVP